MGVSCAVFVNEAAADPCRFTTERPGATNSSATLGAGCLQMEAGASVDRADSTTSVTFPALVRFGIIEPLEVRLGTSLVQIDVPDDDDTTASGTAAVLEVKLMGHLGQGLVPGVGALIGLAAPTNASFSAEASPYTQLLFDWQLADNLSWSVNGIFTLAPADEPSARVGTFGLASVLWLDVPEPVDWLGVYVDGSGGVDFRGESSWDQRVGGGFAFKVLPNRLQLDLSTSVGVTGDNHPVNVSTGFAWQL